MVFTCFSPVAAMSAARAGRALMTASAAAVQARYGVRNLLFMAMPLFARIPGPLYPIRPRAGPGLSSLGSDDPAHILDRRPPLSVQPVPESPHLRTQHRIAPEARLKGMAGPGPGFGGK